ncbi:MAG: rhodanese-like domain-containing protein [Nitrospirae bacterium]|nr:MAG: rhodanese-like domain-containing protein [Nitrospirota bacterium]
MLRKSLLVVLSLFLVFVGMASRADAAKPTTAAACKQCHPPVDDVVRGTFFGVSEKFRTIQVSVGSLIWVIKYGDDLKLTGADKITAIPKEKEIGVKFSGGEKTPYAVSLDVKPPAKVAPEKLVSTGELLKLIAAGPEKGKFTLLDSRPAPRYVEGHIPFALSLPQPAFDKLKDTVLPKEKDRLLIFYCGGVT